MEKNNVKRLPVTRGDQVVGIVSRANLLQAVASLARQIPDPTADDDHIRNRIIDALTKNDWCPFGLSVIVRDGIVHLSGVITEERSRQAAIVAAENVTGVKKVHDHLCWVDTMSGMYLNSPEDDDWQRRADAIVPVARALPSKQLAVRPKERMRPVKIADRDLMGDDAAESLAGKPGVEMKGRRLDLERWLSQLRRDPDRRRDLAPGKSWSGRRQTSSASRDERGRWRSVARADAV